MMSRKEQNFNYLGKDMQDARKRDRQKIKSAREEMKELSKFMYRDIEKSWKNRKIGMNFGTWNTNSNAGIQEDSYRNETQILRIRAKYSY